MAGFRTTTTALKAALLAAFAELQVQPSQIAGQIPGGQVARAAPGQPGVVDLDSVPGAFTDLADAPASYAGQGGKVVAVKSDASGLEFVASGGGGGGGGGASVGSGAYSALPAAGTAGNLYLPTDAPYILRDTGAAWQAWGPIRQLVIPPSSGWSWANQGGASVSTAAGAVALTVPASSAVNLRVYHRAAPATPYTITMLLAAEATEEATHNWGVGWRDSSSGRLANIRFQLGTAISGRWDSPTSFNGNYSVINLRPPLSGVWVRLSDDGTARSIAWSASGLTWQTLHSVGRTDYLTPDQIHIFANPQNGTYGLNVALLSYAVS